jgi:hypothetical protein
MMRIEKPQILISPKISKRSLWIGRDPFQRQESASSGQFVPLREKAANTSRRPLRRKQQLNQRSIREQFEKSGIVIADKPKNSLVFFAVQITTR